MSACNEARHFFLTALKSEPKRLRSSQTYNRHLDFQYATLKDFLSTFSPMTFSTHFKPAKGQNRRRCAAPIFLKKLFREQYPSASNPDTYSSSGRSRWIQLRFHNVPTRSIADLDTCTFHLHPVSFTCAVASRSIPLSQCLLRSLLYFRFSLSLSLSLCFSSISQKYLASRRNVPIVWKVTKWPKLIKS